MPRKKKINLPIKKIYNPFWENIFRKNDSEISENINLLSKIKLFEGLNKKDLVYINNIVYERFYEIDEYIFKEGNPASTMFIIKKGTVNIEKATQNNIEIHSTLQTGDFFGETSLIDESEREVSAKSISRTTVLIIFRNDLFDLFEKEPKLGVKVLKNFSFIINERLKKSNKELILQIRKNEELIARVNEINKNNETKNEKE